MALGLDDLTQNIKSFNLADHKLLAVDLIQGDYYQPRDGIDESWVDELAESFEKYGQLTPITVIFEEGIYKPIDGHHRLEAARKLGWSEVEVLVQSSETPEGQRREHALITNLKRKGLNPWEVGRTLQSLKAEYNYTLEQLGKVVGKGKATVQDYLRIPELPSAFYEDFLEAEGKISPAMVVEIAREADQKERDNLWKAVREGYVTTRDEVRQLKNQNKRRPKPIKKSTKKDRLIRDLASLAQNTQTVLDEGIDLALDEYEKAQTSLKVIQKYLRIQKEKLQK